MLAVCPQCGSEFDKRHNQIRCSETCRNEYTVEYQRKYRRQNHEKQSAYFRQYYQANKSRIVANMAEWQTVNPGYSARNAKAWRSANIERFLEKNRRWREANPERHRSSQQARKARRRAQARSVLSIPFTPEQLEQRIRYYGGTCWICRERPWEHVDHVKPLSKGGPNILANLRPACALCNVSKNNKWPFDVEAARWQLLSIPVSSTA